MEYCLPRHVAIIMDGNGRWAKRRGLPRLAGHEQGARTAQQMVEEAAQLGVEYLTLYTFSSENWRRPASEIDSLMQLLGDYLERHLPRLLENGVRLRVMGQLDKLPLRVQQQLQHTLDQTRQQQGMVLNMALSYGGRQELLRACQRLAEAAVQGQLDGQQIQENDVEQMLETADMPDPDLLIRTSGEQRISNFLLWQLAYTEMYFSDLLWPDFHIAELHRALQAYSQRQRRFGSV